MVRRRSRRRRRTFNRRRRRHNAWPGAKRRHRLAAKKGWRKRRRRRSRNPGFSYNRPRKGRRRRRRSFNRRRRRYNTGALSLRRPFGTLTAGFQPRVLTRAAVITGGALGNAWLSGMISGFLPSALQAGVGSYVTGLASAGVLGAGVGMVSPRLAGDVFFGGVLEVVTRAVKQYVLPVIPGMSGMGDYFQRDQLSQLRPLGDYLTVGDAQRAQALGDYYGDSTVADELVA